MKIMQFTVDVTPPLGFPMAYGINEKIHSRIYIRGLAVSHGGVKAALVSCDYLSVSGKAYMAWKKIIADAIGTDARNVFLHSVHQHDSLKISLELGEISRKYISTEPFPEWYFKKVSSDLRKAVTEAAASGKWKLVKDVGVSECRIKGLASNRRMLGADGKVRTTRWSASVPELQKEPVGLIDPMLRTLAFIGQKGKVMAALHFYATHPQSITGRNMITSDVPGAALSYAGKHGDPETFHIYFTGCGGNVTFGKYNLADKRKNPPDLRIRRLGEKLGKGILSNIRHLRKKRIGDLYLKHVHFEFPLARKAAEASLSALDRKLSGKMKSGAPAGTALFPEGYLMAVRNNWRKLRRPVVSRLSFGDGMHILSLPAETVVEYQLYAQSVVPEDFLACAAYGEYSYLYIPTAAMYEEGGYEPYASIASPEVEARYKNAICRLLA